MSLYGVAKRLTGWLPKTPLTLAQDAISEAMETIYNQIDWSFQKEWAAWLAPGTLFDTGTFTVAPYSNQVIADADVTAALLAYTGQPLLTQLQYRDPAYSVYNIVDYDDGQTSGQGNYPYATLTLDRPWMEPTSGSGQPFMIYQVYFVAPVQDFRKFIEIRDTTNDQPMDFSSKTQAMLAVEDPQRSDFSNPRFVVPAGTDKRPGSSTLGWQLFELWPHQGNYVPYTFTYRRRGDLPSSPSDFMSMVLPQPITEKMVEWKAREVLCQYQEAQKDRMTPKGNGANWMLLSQMAEKKYAELTSLAMSIDLNLDGESLTKIYRPGFNQTDAYATMNGGINLGSYKTE